MNEATSLNTALEPCDDACDLSLARRVGLFLVSAAMRQRKKLTAAFAVPHPSRHEHHSGNVVARPSCHDTGSMFMQTRTAYALHGAFPRYEHTARRCVDERMLQLAKMKATQHFARHVSEYQRIFRQYVTRRLRCKPSAVKFDPLGQSLKRIRGAVRWPARSLRLNRGPRTPLRSIARFLSSIPTGRRVTTMDGRMDRSSGYAAISRWVSINW